MRHCLRLYQALPRTGMVAVRLAFGPLTRWALLRCSKSRFLGRTNRTCCLRQSSCGTMAYRRFCRSRLRLRTRGRRSSRCGRRSLVAGRCRRGPRFGGCWLSGCIRPWQSGLLAESYCCSSWSPDLCGRTALWSPLACIASSRVTTVRSRIWGSAAVIFSSSIVAAYLRQSCPYSIVVSQLMAQEAPRVASSVWHEGQSRFSCGQSVANRLFYCYGRDHRITSLSLCLSRAESTHRDPRRLTR